MPQNTETYGVCVKCGTPLVPEWFTDKEYNSRGYPTGRVRRAVSHLECPKCWLKECVDDTFDGPWYYPNSAVVGTR